MSLLPCHVPSSRIAGHASIQHSSALSTTASPDYPASDGSMAGRRSIRWARQSVPSRLSNFVPLDLRSAFDMGEPRNSTLSNGMVEYAFDDGGSFINYPGHLF